ncbi:ABC transporter ATP-binding protein [Cuneatibacter caecimuris]|uniref:ATP-binding cassette subfamily B protein n=1 Tax=Cuneatibacter caecimuris TaxID=1796618 RepID=A0A4Q7PP85_9FIRM|nr:ABC transporter ATP-binding protein [Cuneatibacter caecimuris]RZT02663.1 ATP-binding cassette subfamily B protein [Cuneatibacter caecimuris]
MAVNSFREDEQQAQVSKWKTLTRLYRYLLAYKSRIAVVLLIMLATISINMINPLIVEQAVNVHIANRDMKGLLLLGLAAVVLNLIMVAGVKARMIMMAKLSNQVLLTIREELYVHIQKLSFSFFDSRPTGKILARIIGDVNSLKDMLSDSVTTLIPDFLTVIGVITIMMAKNVKLALAALLTLPFMAAGMFVIQRVSHKAWQVYRKKSSNISAFVHEEMSGMRIVQSFRAEQESRDNFDVLLKEHRQSWNKSVRCADLFGSLIELTWGAGGFLLYYIGIKVIGVGEIGIGTFMAFSTYLAMFWSPIRNLANFYNKIVTNLAGAERIFDILDTEPEIRDKSGVGELPDIQGSVEFDRVSFAYSDEPETKVLKDVSFQIRPGETIALVGPTGAGKTTIVNLISRFYNVTEGHIRVDGYDLGDVSIRSLRRQMGVMTQDNFLFSGTVKDNIRYGRLDATDEEIVAAAKAVNAHGFIMQLEKGYDTELSERGQSLSVGQRQLLAFARTMVSNPRILILDEATSSIDTHTEILVQKGIQALLKGRTSFVIAHRLSTIKNADRIFVINHGRIEEAGSHEELLAAKGQYYELYQAQFRSLTSA